MWLLPFVVWWITSEDRPLKETASELLGFDSDGKVETNTKQANGRDSVAAPAGQHATTTTSETHKARQETADALVHVADHLANGADIPKQVVDNREKHLRRTRVVLNAAAERHADAE